MTDDIKKEENTKEVKQTPNNQTAKEVINKENNEKNEDALLAKTPDGKQQDISRIMTDDGKNSLKEVYEEVIKVLKNIYDPEIPVNIHDLGLIYDVKLATNRDVLIVMTLTSPACPVAGTLPGEIEAKVKEHPMIHNSKVHLTFDPPWNQTMMSEEAKLELGFL